MTSQSQNPSDLLPLCKVWPSAAIFRVTRINPCPNFVFTIKDFPILIICAIWQDDNTKALIDEVFLDVKRSGAEPSSGLRRGHTSGHQNPRQRPATPRVAKSATMKSDLTCATVTISQAAFLQPLKARTRNEHYIPLLLQLMPRRGSLQGPLPLPGYTQVERTERVSPAQANVSGAEVPTDSTHADIVTTVVATLQPTTTRTT
jgi:hypothetical protein